MVIIGVRIEVFNPLQTLGIILLQRDQCKSLNDDASLDSDIVRVLTAVGTKPDERGWGVTHLILEAV